MGPVFKYGLRLFVGKVYLIKRGTLKVDMFIIRSKSPVAEGWLYEYPCLENNNAAYTEKSLTRIGLSTNKPIEKSLS